MCWPKLIVVMRIKKQFTQFNVQKEDFVKTLYRCTQTHTHTKKSSDTYSVSIPHQTLRKIIQQSR